MFCALLAAGTHCPYTSPLRCPAFLFSKCGHRVWRSVDVRLRHLGALRLSWLSIVNTAKGCSALVIVYHELIADRESGRMGDREKRQVKKKKEKCVECELFTWVKENQRCDTCDPPQQDRQATMEDKDSAESEEPRRRKQGVADSGGNNCRKCKVEVKRKDNAIMCDLCKKWFHAGCGKCSLSLYRC